METKMNTEQELELEWLFEERTEDPCEHSEHEGEPRVHEGPGEWLLLRDHKGCSTAPKHFVVCDKFYRILFSGVFRIQCVCGEIGIDVMETYTVLGRKGVDF